MMSAKRSGRLHTVRSGPGGGTPLVLLHSAGLDLTYWDGQFAAFCVDYDVVALDLPGHGSSEGGPEDWQSGRATRLVVESIEAFGIERFHVVGLSLGGILAQTVAIDHPSLVASLTLIDTAATFPERARSSMRARAESARKNGMAAVVDSLIEHWFSAQTARERPDLVDRATKTILANDPLVHAAMWEMIAATNLVASLQNVSCPTTVIVGDLDTASPISAAQTLRDGIRGARLQVIPHTAHLSPLEKPALVNRCISSCLAGAH